MKPDKEQDDKNSAALNLLKEWLENHHLIDEINGGGKCIDFQLTTQKNTVFGTAEHTRENWEKGDTSTPNEAFRVRPIPVLKALTDEGIIKFRGVNCVIYDHGEGKGDRTFGVILEYEFDADEVLERQGDSELRRITKDPYKQYQYREE